MSGLAEKNVRTSRKISGLALFKSASPMDYQSIKSAVHPVTVTISNPKEQNSTIPTLLKCINTNTVEMYRLQPGF